MRKMFTLAAMIAVVALAAALSGPAGLRAPSGADASPTITTIDYGPFTVPAAMDYMTPGGIMAISGPCTNCYITKMEPDLVYSPSGSNANFDTNIMMHHIVMFNSTVPDATCYGTFPLGLAGERFLGSGNERTIVQMPAGYGYFIPPSPSLNMNVHIHNEDPTNNKTVAVRLKFTWQPASDNLKPVKPIWLDVEYGVPPARLGENCGNSQYRTGAGCPASCYDDDHWSWTVPGPNWPGTSTPFEGTIVGLGGHVHNYGISVAATNNGVGICTSYAGYGFWTDAPSTYEGSRYYPGLGSGADAEHPASANQPNIVHEWHQGTAIPPDNKYHIQNMSTCGAPPYPHNVLNPGHILEVHSQYNTDGPNPGDHDDGHVVDDVMGIVQAYVSDNCVGVSNPGQEDGDGDGTGDACDPDVMDSDADSWGKTRSETSGGCPTAGAQLTFRDCIETFVGTSPTDGCANSATPNDEADKHPADANDDTFVNVTDRTLIVLAIKTWAGGAGAYNARYDLNASNSLNVTDRSMLVLYLKASGGAPCTP